MAKNTILSSAKLLRTTGLGSLAVAVAMMALPGEALAQNHGRWNGGGGQSAQSDGNGGGGGNWNGRGSNSGGDRNANGGGGGGGGSQPVAGDNGGQGNWRSRSAEAQTAAPSTGRQRGDGNGARWSNGNNGQGDPVARTQRQVQAEQRQNVQPGNGQQWSGRNRTYSDPNRNGTYRQGWRSGQSDNRQDRGDPRQGYRQGSRDGDRWQNDNRGRNDGNRWANGRWDGNNGQRWNRDWRRDSRYDWSGYRNSHRDVFRMGSYYAPYRNYSYRRVGVGFYLDSLFFGSRYWLDEPSYYNLPPAYGPYRWIRYYNDALLVDAESGEVVDAINDFFW